MTLSGHHTLGNTESEYWIKISRNGRSAAWAKCFVVYCFSIELCNHIKLGFTGLGTSSSGPTSLFYITQKKLKETKWLAWGFWEYRSGGGIKCFISQPSIF